MYGGQHLEKGEGLRLKAAWARTQGPVFNSPYHQPK